MAHLTRDQLGNLVTDQAIGIVDNLLSRSVSAMEPDHFRLRKALGEIKQEGWSGTGEAVNGLCRITNDADLFAVAQPEVE